MECLNRKAKFDYTIEDTYVCGIVLKGGEVKSIRMGGCYIGDSFAIINGGEVWLVNSSIREWSNKSCSFMGGYEDNRQRKLLLNRKEINKLSKIVQNPGYTLVPLKIYFTDKGLCKVLLGVGKGKHNYDKRETIKQRDIERDLNRKF